MAASGPLNKNKNILLSPAMERTGKWVLSQEIPTDVIVEVGEANFSLHKCKVDDTRHVDDKVELRDPKDWKFLV